MRRVKDRWEQIPERRVMVLLSELVAKLTLPCHVASDFHGDVSKI